MPGAGASCSGSSRALSSCAWPPVCWYTAVIRVSSARSQSGACSAVAIWSSGRKSPWAFDQPVGVQQQPVAGHPGCCERGVVICEAQRQAGLSAGQGLQDAADAQQRRVMAAVDHGQLAGGGDLCQRRGDEALFAQVRPNRLADLARDLLHRRCCDGGPPEGAEHLPGEQDGVQAVAADVADDQPDPVPGGNDLIQVTAGRGLAGGRAVRAAMVIPVISGGSGGSSASWVACAIAACSARGRDRALT